jgi:hypothetical protein
MEDEGIDTRDDLAEKADATVLQSFPFDPDERTSTLKTLGNTQGLSDSQFFALNFTPMQDLASDQVEKQVTFKESTQEVEFPLEFNFPPPSFCLQSSQSTFHTPSQTASLSNTQETDTGIVQLNDTEIANSQPLAEIDDIEVVSQELFNHSSTQIGFVCLMIALHQDASNPKRLIVIKKIPVNKRI